MMFYPVLDWLGAPLLVVAFAALFWVEKLRPLRRRVQDWLRRAWINLVVAAPAFLVLRLLLIPAVVSVATWAGRHGWGLARQFSVPPVLGGIIAILVLDYSMFVWHWLNHRVPFLWRFHHVHHSDLDLDVTTAFRFHFGEMLFSVAVRSLQVVVSGASPTVALIYEILLEGSTEFHHSNLRLPAAVDRVLGWFIMTPRAHGIHHSVVPAETNSNFSNFLIVWDRIHRTHRRDVPQDAITIGVADYRDPRELTIISLLLMPFRRQRSGRPLRQ